MSRWPILFAIAVLAISTTSAMPIFAQGVGAVPSPYGPPPFSPWLNLYQKQGGPLDPYHMFVQPNLQLNNALQYQQADIQRNAAALGTVSDRVMSQMEAANASPEPTGMNAGFLNHGIYFNTHRRNGLGAGVPGASGAVPSRGAYSTPGTNMGGYGSLPGTNMGGYGGVGRSM